MEEIIVEVDVVAFDVLLKASTEAEPNLATVPALRVSPEVVNRCRLWFGRRGVEVYSTDFGLACRAPRSVFESLFGVHLERTEESPGMPNFAIKGSIRMPSEIAEFVDQITLTASPEFF